MKKIPLFILGLIGSLIFLPVLRTASETGLDPVVNPEFLNEFSLRALGPAMRPGRIADIAVNPRNRNIWYLAHASSGLWKTMNRGISWQPLFDECGSYSLGCVTIDNSDPDVIWLGTGENISNRSVGFGDGIYKSLDGGNSWSNMGLYDSQHIAKILIDPRNSDVVFVAAEGPLWAPGGDRGVYKTIDGGRTWKAVLTISENTGVTSLAIDPGNPDILYASSYQRRRHVGVLIGGGPESAIYKTSDGGETWIKLTQGLPAVDKGRIALAVSPQNPAIVYALITAAGEESGFFSSEDRGTTWIRQSNYKVIDPQYYGEIYPDPHQFDRIYVEDMRIQVTEDGGKHFEPVPWQMHVDHHAITFDTTDVNHLLVGNDGGLYESYDHGTTWRHFNNLMTAQFYRVEADNSEPFYFVHGGTQDNGSMAGPSRTMNRVGIRTSDWIRTGGGDGFQCRVDPADTNIVYSMSQNGAVRRLDKRTGISVDIRPPREENQPPVRWHWDTPFIISPHSPTRLYFAGSRLFRSDNRGDSWQIVSPDLTRKLDREKILVMGRTWGDDAVQKDRFTTALSVSSAIAESALKEGLICIGTDDGLLQITENGGEIWKKIDTFPGIPDKAYVSDVCASQHDTKTLFVAFNNWQQGDFNPYLLKSSDLGQTWTSITKGLPDRHVIWTIVEDHVNPNLLFTGTEFGLFVSVDGGLNWVQLKNGVPTIPFRDLAIQQQEDDLVAATFGRGFYVLDDYSALRYFNTETWASEAVLFPPHETKIYPELDYVDAGFGNFTTSNPPFGATLTYYVSGNLAPAEVSSISLVITDARGESIRRIERPLEAGLHRVVWDLRREAPPQDPGSRRRPAQGSLVEPGTFTVTLIRMAAGRDTVLGTPQTLKITALSGFYRDPF